MFESLQRAIGELVIPADPGVLAALLAVRDRLEAKIAAAVGAVDAVGGFEASGASSMHAWLRDEGVSRQDAARLVKTGRRLQRLPAVADAWAEGELSGGQVQAIVDHVPEAHLALFADHEREVVPALVGLDGAETARVMREWKQRADALSDEGEAEMPARSLHHSVVGECWALDGDFDAEGGAVVDHALIVADSGDYTQPRAARRAEALVDVCRFFLDHHNRAPVVRHRPHVNLVVHAGDHERGELVDSGLPLDPATTSRLLCDCSINRVVADKVARAASVMLDYGTTTRVVSPALWSALACATGTAAIRAAIGPRAGATPTTSTGSARAGLPASTTSCSCAEDHTLLHHKRGFHAKLLSDATFEVTLPDGTTRTSHVRARAGPVTLAC